MRVREVAMCCFNVYGFCKYLPVFWLALEYAPNILYGKPIIFHGRHLNRIIKNLYNSHNFFVHFMTPIAISIWLSIWFWLPKYWHLRVNVCHCVCMCLRVCFEGKSFSIYKYFKTIYYSACDCRFFKNWILYSLSWGFAIRWSLKWSKSQTKCSCSLYK